MKRPRKIRQAPSRSPGLSETELARIIRALPVPQPWDRATFVRSVEQVRGRQITLLSVDGAVLAGGACGLWLVRDDDDVVLYQGGTSRLHADQIILHELGHMLLGHDKTATPDPANMVAALTPDLDLATVKAALGRSAYRIRDEHDAELFASLILSRPRRDRTLKDILLGQE